MSATLDWLRVKDLFARAMDQPDDQRDRFLQIECAGDDELLHELRSLFAAQSAPDRIGPVMPNVLTPMLDAAENTPCIDERIGPYRLLRLLGEGGMGRVFLAERADGQFHHQVALKLIRSEFASTEMRERFLRERDILARLAHPNIAQLHDGGVSADGSPYFTLEYVEGEPITRWCDDRKLGLADRQRLLLKVCDAVQYAHRNLIVHRDLKPSNILVTADGEPKLLDFGIAKPLDETEHHGLTDARSQPMTREYAAPEQVLGEPVTTATDVYALGVLLYELLCGHSPYARAERGEISWPKAIVEESPESLTRALSRSSRTDGAEHRDNDIVATRGTPERLMRKFLRGDLERITRRALEKSPEARFPSVGAMADDLLAHLEGRALPGGNRRYRLAKFMRRHRVGVAAAVVIATLAIAGVAGIVYQARETARQAQTVTTVKDFLIGIFNASSPNEAKGRDLSVRELLDRGSSQIEHSLETQPQLRSEMQGVLGRIYFQLGLYDQARALQVSALAASRTSAPLNVAALERQYAETLAARGDFAEAERVVDEASLAIDENNAGSLERIRTLIARSGVEQKAGKSELAEAYAASAVALARASDVSPEILGNALNAQGLAEWDLRNVQQSEALYREALKIHRDLFGDDDLRVANDRQSLTLALRNLGRYDEALEQARLNVAILEKILGPRHPDLSRGYSTLGTTLYHMGRYEEAEPALRHSVAVARDSLGDNPLTATAMNNLGLVLTDWHGLDEAEQLYKDAIKIYTAYVTPGHNNLLISMSNLGYVHTLQGKLALAESELRDVLARDRQYHLKDEVWELNRLGLVRRLRGDWKEAETLHRQALIESTTLFAPNSRQTALSHYYLGAALADGGQTREAESELRASLAAFKVLIPPNGDHPFAASARLALGSLLAANADTRTEGLSMLREASELRTRFFGADDPRTLQARETLASASAPASTLASKPTVASRKK